MKIEKIIGIGFFIAIISLLGVQLIVSIETCSYDGYAKSVYVEDDIAYVADVNLGLVIMDVSNPSESRELGRLELVSAYGLEVYVRNQIAYLVGNRILRLINISDLSSPSQISTFGTNVDGMCVDFPFFYIFSSNGGFRIYNLTDHLIPSQLSYIDLGVYIRDVYYTGNKAYIANGDGLKIIDTSNLSNPIDLGQFYNEDGYQSCVVAGHIAYTIGMSGYIDIIDVSDPTDPTIMNQFGVGDFFGTAISFLDDTLYIPSGYLELIDVTNPLNPFKYSQIRGSFLVEDGYIAYPYAYLACADCGLKIVDISDPSFWNSIPSILNSVITFMSIGVIVVLILLKSIFQKKNV